MWLHRLFNATIWHIHGKYRMTCCLHTLSNIAIYRHLPAEFSLRLKFIKRVSSVENETAPLSKTRHMSASCQMRSSVQKDSEYSDFIWCYISTADWVAIHLFQAWCFYFYTSSHLDAEASQQHFSATQKWEGLLRIFCFWLFAVFGQLQVGRIFKCFVESLVLRRNWGVHPH